MAVIASTLTICGIAILLWLSGYWLGQKSTKDKYRHPKKVTEEEMPILHPNSGRFCHVCGCDTHKSTVFHDQKQHEIPKARYCHICGAGPGENCDAGLHG